MCVCGGMPSKILLKQQKVQTKQFSEQFEYIQVRYAYNNLDTYRQYYMEYVQLIYNDVKGQIYRQR